MSDVSDRKLFVVTFLVDPEGLPPLPNGQERTMHVPAFVEDIATAGEKAEEYMADFKNTPEGKQNPNAKLSIRAIMAGGTILT